MANRLERDLRTSQKLPETSWLEMLRGKADNTLPIQVLMTIHKMIYGDVPEGKSKQDQYGVVPIVPVAARVAAKVAAEVAKRATQGFRSFSRAPKSGNYRRHEDIFRPSPGDLSKSVGSGRGVPEPPLPRPLTMWQARPYRSALKSTLRYGLPAGAGFGAAKTFRDNAEILREDSAPPEISTNNFSEDTLNKVLQLEEGEHDYGSLPPRGPTWEAAAKGLYDEARGDTATTSDTKQRVKGSTDEQINEYSDQKTKERLHLSPEMKEALERSVMSSLTSEQLAQIKKEEVANAVIASTKGAVTRPDEINLSPNPLAWLSNLARDAFGLFSGKATERRIEKEGQRNRLAGIETARNLPNKQQLATLLGGINLGRPEGEITPKDALSILAGQRDVTTQGYGSTERKKESTQATDEKRTGTGPNRGALWSALLQALLQKEQFDFNQEVMRHGPSSRTSPKTSE